MSGITGGVLLLLQLVMAAVLCWSCLCRVTKTNGDTRREVRWAMVFEGGCAGLLFGAPFFPWLMPDEFDHPLGTTPTWVWLVFLFSILVVQFVTAKYWARGVPHVFQLAQEPGPLPEPAPQGHPRMLALIAAVFAVVSLALPRTASAEAPPDGAPLVAVPAGGVINCYASGGCVGMSAALYHQLRQALQEAAQKPVDCRRSPST